MRTSSILKDWEKAWETPVDQVHLVIEFASLADEERFALRAIEDKIYFQGWSTWKV